MPGRAHLRTTWRPIGPSLAATGALLRQGGGRAFILGAACFLAAMAAAVVAEDVFAQSTYNILKHGVDVLSSHPLDEINRDIARALAISELIEAPVLSLAILVLYLGTAAIAALPTARLDAALAAGFARDRIAAGATGVAILFAPVLVIGVIEIFSHCLGLWGFTDPIGALPFSWRGLLAVVWFILAAPFTLPVVPLSLIQDDAPSLAAAACLGWDRYLQFAALAIATTAPFVATILLIDRSLRTWADRYLVGQLHLRSFGRAIFDAPLILLALAAVVAAAAAFVAVIGPRAEVAPACAP